MRKRRRGVARAGRHRTAGFACYRVRASPRPSPGTSGRLRWWWRPPSPSSCVWRWH